jgi:hypothetical protein
MTEILKMHSLLGSLVCMRMFTIVKHQSKDFQNSLLRQRDLVQNHVIVE